MLQRAHYSKSIVIFCSLFDPACQGFLCNVWLLLLLFVAWLGSFSKVGPFAVILKSQKSTLYFAKLCTALTSIPHSCSTLLINILWIILPILPLLEHCVLLWVCVWWYFSCRFLSTKLKMIGVVAWKDGWMNEWIFSYVFQQMRTICR